MSIIIKQSQLVNIEGSFDILIENSYIKKIGTNLDAPRGAKVIKARDCLALPGLINAHTHCAMTLLRGYADDMPLMPWLHGKIWPAESKLTANSIYWGSLLACLEMIRSGTTGYADMYMRIDSMVKAAAESGLRASLGEVIFKSEDLLRQESAIANWQGSYDNRIQIMLAPHSLYACEEQVLRQAVKIAEKTDLHIHMHLAETLAETKTIWEQQGKSPIGYAESLGFFQTSLLAAHMVQVSPEDITTMRPFQNQINIAFNPHSNMKLVSGMAPINSFYQEGFNVAIGTDGPSSNNSLNMFSEMKTASLLAKMQCGDATALSADLALQMATANGAKACRFEGVGYLKEGAKADIILLDLNNPSLQPVHNKSSLVVYSSAGSNVKTMVVDGQILMQDYQMTILDEEKIIFEAVRAAKALTA